MGDEVAISKIDRMILLYCDSESPEAIAERFNGAITAKAVAERTQKLLGDPNWLTQAQQEEVILLRMRLIAADMAQGFQDLDSQKAQIATLEAIAKRLDKRREATAVDLNSLYQNQATIMLRAIDIATGYLRGAFREKIDQQQWDEAIREGMALAAAELEKHKALE